MRSAPKLRVQNLNQVSVIQRGLDIKQAAYAAK